MIRDIFFQTWTFGKSVYDQRAGIGASMIALGTTMLGYDYKKEFAVPCIVIGTALAAQGKPILAEKNPDAS